MERNFNMIPTKPPKALKSRTEYEMIEAGTDEIGAILTELAEEGWSPMGNPQSYIDSRERTRHSILVMRIVRLNPVKLNPPPTVEFRK